MSREGVVVYAPERKGGAMVLRCHEVVYMLLLTSAQVDAVCAKMSMTSDASTAGVRGTMDVGRAASGRRGSRSSATARRDPSATNRANPVGARIAERTSWSRKSSFAQEGGGAEPPPQSPRPLLRIDPTFARPKRLLTRPPRP